jgi:hypothetical protein
VAVTIEVTRNTQNATGWDVVSKGDCGKYEKVDMDTFKYTLELKPGERRNLVYVITQKFGTRLN